MVDDRETSAPIGPTLLSANLPIEKGARKVSLHSTFLFAKLDSFN